MKLTFLPEAREELGAAASYLNDRAPGLGMELLDDAERTSAFLCQFPAIGRPLDSLHRSIPLQRFSYSLAYRADGDEVIIVAVAHNRRRPGYWRQRR